MNSEQSVVLETCEHRGRVIEKVTGGRIRKDFVWRYGDRLGSYRRMQREVNKELAIDALQEICQSADTYDAVKAVTDMLYILNPKNESIKVVWFLHKDEKKRYVFELKYHRLKPKRKMNITKKFNIPKNQLKETL